MYLCTKPSFHMLEACDMSTKAATKTRVTDIIKPGYLTLVLISPHMSQVRNIYKGCEGRQKVKRFHFCALVRLWLE